MLHKTLPEHSMKGLYTLSTCDVIIILIPKLYKDIKIKLQINTLVITGEKILNRILQTNLKIYFKKNL